MTEPWVKTYSGGKPNYTQPEEQEPIAYINVEERKLEWAHPIKWETPTVVKMDKVPLYTAPPQREWQGLTQEEYTAIRYGSDENGDPNVEYELFDEGEYGMEINIYVDDFYRAIEAKLREKNG